MSSAEVIRRRCVALLPRGWNRRRKTSPVRSAPRPVGQRCTSPRSCADADQAVVAGGRAGKSGAAQGLAQALLDGHWDQARAEFGSCRRARRRVRRSRRPDRAPDARPRARRKQWTTARRKESLQRVLAGSRLDAQLLQRRLWQLVGSWDGDGEEAPCLRHFTDRWSKRLPSRPRPPTRVWSRLQRRPRLPSRVGLAPGRPGWRKPPVGAWPAGARPRGRPDSLPAGRSEGRGPFAGVDRRRGAAVRRRPASAGAAGAPGGQLAGRASSDRGPVRPRRGRQLEKGQLVTLRQTFEHGVTSRGVRSASELLRKTREQQNTPATNTQARDALKGLINQIFQELGDPARAPDVSTRTSAAYADAIDRAESLVT